MAPERVATDNAFNGALASLARLHQDEVARMTDAQARLSRLLRRGRAACLQGCNAMDLRAWGEDVVAELAAFGLSEPDGLLVEEPAGTSAAAALRGAASPANKDVVSLLDVPGPPGSVNVELSEPTDVSLSKEYSVIDLSLSGPLSHTLGTLEIAGDPERARDKHFVAELSLSNTLETLENAGSPGAASEGAAAVPAVAPNDANDRGQRHSTVQSKPTDEASLVDLTGSTWQWYHRTGFRSYTAAEAARIEEAWRSGESKVRLKAGKTGKTPMQIFFADMVQLDPTSGNQRKVRRTGGESLFGWLERSLLGVWKCIHTGQLRWETCQQYKKRQEDQKAKQPSIDQSMMVSMSQMFSATQFSPGQSTRREYIGLWCGRLVQAQWWRVLTWLVTALNVFWIYHMAQNYDSTVAFWRPPAVFLGDLSFLLFFSTELIVRLLSYRDPTAALQSVLFLRDAWVVILTFVEVVLFPLIILVFHPGGMDEHLDPDSAWFAFALVVRVSRLVRVERLFRIFPQASTIARAIMSGFGSAAIISMIMAGFLFGFSVLFKTGVRDQDVKDKYFSTMSLTLETVIVQGLFFDGVLDYLQDCHDDNVGYFGMFFFIGVGQYLLLNMLIGIFSSVAADATSEQVDRRATEYLENHLASIMECYLEDVPRTPSGTEEAERALLGKDSFNLILQNLDVLDVLEACGTDIEGLQSMKDMLFPEENSQISFKELYEVLLRLRKGKPASVADVLNLRELTRRRTQELKELLLHRRFLADEGGDFDRSEAKRP